MILARIGVYGLGTMGSALALNMAEHGVTVAVTSRGADRVREFVAGAGDLATRLVPHERLKDFVSGLARPRLMLFMIPSGAPLDAMIEKVVPLLEPGDTIIDGGNADFHRTRRRAAALAQEGLHFVGMGVSGGAEGARHGPSMMVGGSEESWQRLRPILELIAARYKGDPCVARVGPDGAGHFVKMVHNGIEYADMQMIAEIYGLLRFGAAWTPEAIGRLFAGWNRGALRSYLLEITADILQCFDPETGHPMVDVIRDSAGQKGTGRWTVIEAVRLGQSASMIEAALGARAWSAEKDTRMAIEGALGGARGALDPDPERLAQAMWTARLLAHAQGFRVMAAASPEFGWSLDLARIAEIWRAGCIIRSAMLDDIAEAFRGAPPRGELILSPLLAERLEGGLAALREEVASAVPAGHAVPVLSAGLQWIDTMRQGFGTAGIIQAQRDYFGRHGFERFDREGLFHGPWWRG